MKRPVWNQEALAYFNEQYGVLTDAELSRELLRRWDIQIGSVTLATRAYNEKLEVRDRPRLIVNVAHRLGREEREVYKWLSSSDLLPPGLGRYRVLDDAKIGMIETYFSGDVSQPKAKPVPIEAGRCKKCGAPLRDRRSGLCDDCREETRNETYEPKKAPCGRCKHAGRQTDQAYTGYICLANARECQPFFQQKLFEPRF